MQDTDIAFDLVQSLTFLRKHQILPVYSDYGPTASTNQNCSLFYVHETTDQYVELIDVRVIDDAVCSLHWKSALFGSYEPNPNVLKWACFGYYVTLNEVDNLCKFINTSELSCYLTSSKKPRADFTPKEFMLDLMINSHQTWMLNNPEYSHMLRTLGRMVNTYKRFGEIFVIDEQMTD